VTVPLAGIFLVWALAVGARYGSFGLRYGDSHGNPGMLQPIMKLEWLQMWRHARLALQTPATRRAFHVDRLQILLDPAKEAELNAALPRSGGEYVEAQLIYPDGHVGKAEARYRGDFYWHWTQEKKSWRIKTRKSDLWNGMRWINLVVPKSAAIVDGHLSNWLAQQMGLLTPTSGVVEFWVNGENRGLHTLIEQPDELLLRRLGRMPTDLYVGELVGDDTFFGQNPKLFENPATWEKDAVNNHYPEDNKRPLEILCESLTRIDGEPDMTRLRSLLDVQTMARFAFFRVLTQSGHYDDQHNWRLFYDPWKRGFEPLIWDPNAWHRLWAPGPNRPFFQIPLFSKLDRRLAQDHVFRMELHRAALHFFSNEQDGDLLAEWNRLREQMWPAAQRDPALGAYFLYMDMEDVRADCESLDGSIRSYLQATQTVHLGTPIAARAEVLAATGNQLELRFEMDGWRPAEALELLFAAEPPKGGTWMLWEEGVPNPRRLDLEPWLHMEGNRVLLERPWLSGLEQTPVVPPDRLFPMLGHPKAVTYRIVFTHLSGTRPALEEVLVRTTSGNRQSVPWVKGLEAKTLDGEWGIFELADGLSPKVWNGRRELHGITRLRGPLTLEPGTQLLMAPGATLIVEGTLTALGTASKPILIGPIHPSQEPWGSFVLRSQKANGSRLEHVEIRSGSGLQDDLQEFSAMLSIHDAENIVLRDCRFENNQRVDDMVHAVYVQGLQFERCHFRGAHMDSLDLDACSGSMVDSTIEESGNDAIDLMMSKFVVAHSLLAKNGDKGVSVGENSQALLLDCELKGNTSGVQSKDASILWARACRFEGNQTNVYAYLKNWQYGAGGIGLLESCSFDGGAGASADKHSRLWLLDCQGIDGWKPDKHVFYGEAKGELDTSAAVDWPGAESFKGIEPFAPWLSATH
jgi:hypothetical protein